MKIMNNSLVNYQTNSSHIKKFLNKNLINSNISAIKEIMYLTEKEKEKGKNIISLSVGIPYYPMPKYIKDNLFKVLENSDVDKYTFFAGLSQLRDLIAKKSTETLGIKTNRENILITAGSMSALMYTVTALIEENDEIIIPSPYFASYKEQIAINGGKVIEVPLVIKNNSYQLDLEKIEKAITKKTKAILINSPANPTGAVFTKEELLDLAKIIKKNNLYLITDETYDYLIYDNYPYFNIASISYLWPKVIRCVSFSKKYGMTGWRLGYLHTNKELLTHILKIHDATIVCVNHLAQQAGIIALSKDKDKETEKNIKILTENRIVMMDYLNQMDDFFSYIPPRGAYYIFAKYSSKIKSSLMAKKILYETNVAVVPGIGFGKAGEYHLRFSFAGKKEEIIEAFERLKKWRKKFI